MRQTETYISRFPPRGRHVIRVRSVLNTDFVCVTEDFHRDVSSIGHGGRFINCRVVFSVRRSSQTHESRNSFPSRALRRAKHNACTRRNNRTLCKRLAAPLVSNYYCRVLTFRIFIFYFLIKFVFIFYYYLFQCRNSKNILWEVNYFEKKLRIGTFVEGQYQTCILITSRYKNNKHLRLTTFIYCDLS